MRRLLPLILLLPNLALAEPATRSVDADVPAVDGSTAPLDADSSPGDGAVPSVGAAGSSIDAVHTAVPRRDPSKQGCGSAGQAAAIANLESDTAALDGPGAPWRRLLQAGRPGCLAVSAWLAGGAPGLGAGATEKAIGALVARGDAEQLSRLWPLFGRRSDRIDAALVRAYGARLVELGESEAGAVARHPSAAVRREALPLLLGHHSIGRWETVYGRPIWRESALHVSPIPPSPAHLEAVRTVLQQGRGRGETAARFAELAGRLLEEGSPGAEAWVPLLLPLVELAGQADQPTANRAARAIAWGALDAAAPVDVLVSGRRKETLSHYLDGLAARLRARDDLDATLVALARVSEADLGPASARARAMYAAWSRKRA